MPNSNTIPLMSLAAPDLAVQQQEVANRELLAKLLLAQGHRQDWSRNPSPTGAALGSIGDALREGVGMWALLKSQGAQTDLARQQVAAQNQLLQQGFSGQEKEYALPGPAFAGADTPASAYTPYQGDVGPVQVDPIKVSTPGPLVMPGMTQDQAKLAFMLDQPGYMSALASVYSHNAQLPDEIKVIQRMGGDPQKFLPYLIGKYQNAALSPYQQAMQTGTARLQTTSQPHYDPATGRQVYGTEMGNMGMPAAPSPYEQGMQTGKARQETTPQPFVGEGGREYWGTEAGNTGRIKSLSPVETAAQVEQGKQGSSLNPEITKTMNQEFITKTLPEIRQRADDAKSMLAGVETLRNVPVSTGPLTESAKVPLAKLAATLGLGDEALTNYQIFGQAVANRIYDIVRDPMIRGPQTEGDAQRFRNTLAQLGNTGKSNQFIADFMQANGNRLLRRQGFYDEALSAMQQAGDPNLDRINRRWNQIDSSIWNDPIMEKWIKSK